MKEAICLVDAIGLNCMIRRAREDKASLSQLVEGAWIVRVNGVGLEGLLLFVYSNFFSSGLIFFLEGDGEVFHRVLRFPL